jgi:hypothetical protein
VQSKEVAALGDDLPSKLDRRVLLAPRAKEDAEQLRTGERLRTLRQKPLSRPELGRELFDGVSARRHSGILYYTDFRHQAYPGLFTKVVEKREPSPVYGLVARKLTKGDKAPVSDCASLKIRFETSTEDDSLQTADLPGWPRWTKNSECVRRWPNTSQSDKAGEDDTLCSRCSNSVSSR